MTTKERFEVLARLQKLGLSYDEANKLRRIAITLRNWFELECGTGDSRVTRSVERDEDDGKPFLRVQYQGPTGWVDHKSPVADREAGARRRLALILAPHKRRLLAYVQGDCRGASLWILRRRDIKSEERIDALYSTRGVAVY